MSGTWQLRIDERLIHGQVVLGCCMSSHVRRMVLLDDTIAASEFEQELYSLGIEPEQNLEFLGVAECAERMQSPPPENTMIVMRSPLVALELVQAGAPVQRICIGGLNYRHGSRRLLDYVHVTPEEEVALRELLAAGIALECRQVPASEGTDLSCLL
ncbi:MAG: PTS sugar transporter subunit IIB [Calditrichaeota bacterium]|nr:PTS sugar transporter subunit IIB [Candidatus Cloacimonadota bacterium]MCA9786556.1 PTS sugar transporter subunit IIB [Candidatus Cloacimonadota bacterium]MCB1046281.1 PTS sugar transporter subunit IIB [Calditrichota bacterium]